WLEAIRVIHIEQFLERLVPARASVKTDLSTSQLLRPQLVLRVNGRDCEVREQIRHGRRTCTGEHEGDRSGCPRLSTKIEELRECLRDFEPEFSEQVIVREHALHANLGLEG